MEASFSTCALLIMFSYLYIMASLLLIIFPSPCLSDPAPLQDICVADRQASYAFGNGFPCKPLANVTDDDFHYNGTAAAADTNNRLGLGLTFADVNSFPGLNTLGLSVTRGDLAIDGIIPPHVHPRSAELVLVVKGTMRIGFITSTATNRFFSKVVKENELFVVPRGLIHFQQNVGTEPALLYAMFESQQPGLVIIANGLMGSTPPLPTEVLAKAFQMDNWMVEAVKSKFGN